MKNVFQDLVGKSVTLDGVCVGYTTQIEIAQEPDSYPKLRVELTMTPETVDKLREYAVIMETMGDGRRGGV